MRLLPALLAALALLATPAGAASITQLPGASGCFEAAGVDRGCTEGRRLAAPNAVTTSPDGRNVYVVAGADGDGALLTYARDTATGALTEQDCIADSAADGCTRSDAIAGANDVAVAPDGLTVYVLGALPGSIGVFRRDPATGALAEEQCLATGGGGTCAYVKFESLWKFALTADGRALILAGNSVTTVPIGADGLLGTPVRQKLRGTGAPTAVAVSPDGASVYIANGIESNGRLVALDRDPATGTLKTRACAGDGVGVMACRDAHGQDEPTAIAVAPDGKGIYMAAAHFASSDPDNPFSFSGVQRSSALAIFTPARLAQRGCILFTGRKDEGVGCTAAPKARGTGFFGARSIAIAPDGRTVVAGFDKSSAVVLLRRNPATQALTSVAGTGGCVRDANRRRRAPKGCTAGHGIYAPSDIAISPNGRNAYATTDGGLSIFALA